QPHPRRGGDDTRRLASDRGTSPVGHDLWFDPRTTREVAVVSHPHSDHPRRHRHALLTCETLELSPGPRKPRGARLVGLGQTVPRGDARVTLYDAGHMLASAQVLFEHRGVRLPYAGAIKPRRRSGRHDTDR